MILCQFHTLKQPIYVLELKRDYVSLIHKLLLKQYCSMLHEDLIKILQETFDVGMENHENLE